MESTQCSPVKPSWTDNRSKMGVQRASPIDSNIIVQESQKRRPERGWNGEHLLVILSAAKDLARWATRSFASLRMTLGGRFVSPRLMSRWCNMLESMGLRPLPGARGCPSLPFFLAGRRPTNRVMGVQRASPSAGSARVSLASFFFVRAGGPQKD